MCIKGHRQPEMRIREDVVGRSTLEMHRGTHPTESPPSGPTAVPAAGDEWFRTKVLEASANGCPTEPHEQAMQETRALVDGKRHA